MAQRQRRPFLTAVILLAAFGLALATGMVLLPRAGTGIELVAQGDGGLGPTTTSETGADRTVAPTVVTTATTVGAVTMVGAAAGPYSPDVDGWEWSLPLFGDVTSPPRSASAPSPQATSIPGALSPGISLPGASVATTRPLAVPHTESSWPSSTAKPSTTRPKPSTTRPNPSTPSSAQPPVTVAPQPQPTTSRPTSSTTVPGTPRVVWEDHFDSLDQTRWSLEHSTYGDGNNELQCYRPENVSVSGGRLVLQAVTESYTCPNGSTRSVTSGMVRSRGVSFGPGQAIEFRVKLTPADEGDQGGLWPAVWSSGWAGGGWPNGGELDYLEVMTAKDPKRSVYSIHYAKPGGSHGVNNQPVYGTENFSASWHTVRFEYGFNGQLAWYLDGSLVHQVTEGSTAQGYPAPFDQATSEIKINLALGGRPGPLAPGAVGNQGATFEIDYIRVVTL